VNALTPRASSAISLAPNNMAEAMQFSKMLADSNMVPAAFRGKPADVLVAVIWGSEIGLGPLQAVQNIAVINGRPSIWGDAALALVRGHPACAGIREGVEGEGDAQVGYCEVTRRGEHPQRRTFSVADAKKAGLWGKAGPWQQYPQRMLQMRARGFAIRDVFPDALRGVITAEEAQDMPAPRDVPNLAPPEPGSSAAVMTALQAPAGITLPLIGPDGELYQIKASGDRPAVMVWMSAARKAIGKLEDAPALRLWRNIMGKHLAEVSETEPEAVKAVEDAWQARYDMLAPAVEPEPEDEGEETFPGDLPSREG
jgi:hypothetical protein